MEMLTAARPAGRAARRRWQRITSGTRVLPDFVIIGAQKSGTSSLYEYICAHPAVVRAATKEVHFFDTHYGHGERWYRSHFPTDRRLERVARRLGTRAVTGEASPYYLFHPAVPRRLHRMLPDARLIAVLREPVERAVSHHNHRVDAGVEPLCFADAIAAEEGRLAGADELLAGGDPHAAHFSHQHHSYLSRGRYAEQLERWLALFDREQLLVLDAAELFRDPAAVTRRAHGFLGLPPHDLEAYAVAGGRDHDDIDGPLRARLEDHFAPHNARLRELLGHDFGWKDGSRR
jgi:Sulfotransferase domain